MSGGIQECIEIKKLDYTEKSKLWDIMYKAFKKDAILSCSINVSIKKIIKRVLIQINCYFKTEF